MNDAEPEQFGLSLQFLRSILDSVADGVYAVNSDYIIVFFNRAAERITGIPKNEAIGAKCWDVFRSDVCESDCPLRRSFESRKNTTRTVFILDSDGERVPVRMSASVLHTGKDKAFGVVTFQDLTMIEELKREAGGKYSFCEIISRNREMKEIFEILPDVAASDSTILITGESGTGKELIARALHRLGSRKDRELITVNCAAIPDNLLESELFGYVAGAFTDAKKARKGRFTLADGGTIFLDEIAEISPALQVKLLRVLQYRAFEPLGSSETVNVDVRIIAATNKDLRREMEGGSFRSDLYFRLNIMEIRLPPLRERKEDIPLLAAHFIERFNRLRNRDIIGLAPSALEAFLRYEWPGNIRELENAIEHAFILCRSGLIQLVHLPETLRSMQRPDKELPGTLADMERNAILLALESTDWNRSAAAKLLGIHTTTLWRKMRRFNLGGE